MEFGFGLHRRAARRGPPQRTELLRLLSMWRTVSSLAEAGTAKTGPEMVRHQPPFPGSLATSSQAKHSVSCKSGCFQLPSACPEAIFVGSGDDFNFQ